MKRMICLFLGMLFATVSANAQGYGQRQNRRGQPCREHGRVASAAKGGATMGLLGALIGAAAAPKGHRGEVALKSGAIWGGIGAGTEASLPSCDEVNGREESPRETRKGIERDEDLSHPSRIINTDPYLKGQVVGIRYERMHSRSNKNPSIVISRVLDQMGATLNEPDWGRDACRIPGKRVLCLEVGEFRPLTRDSRYGNAGVDLGGIGTRGGERKRTEKWVVGFTIKVYDNPSDPNQVPQFTPAVADAVGEGTAEEGQRYQDLYLPGMSVSGGSSHQDSRDYAMIGALIDALGKIEWRRSALEFLQAQQ